VHTLEELRMVMGMWLGSPLSQQSARPQDVSQTHCEWRGAIQSVSQKEELSPRCGAGARGVVLGSCACGELGLLIPNSISIV
jgi:hypothetical protein